MSVHCKVISCLFVFFLFGCTLNKEQTTSAEKNFSKQVNLSNKQAVAEAISRGEKPIRACAVNKGSHDQDLMGFIDLLTRENTPSLKEASFYSGECGGESELDFVLDHCEKQWGDMYGSKCISYSKERCSNSEKSLSLELDWIRLNYSTVGKTYYIIETKEYDNEMKYDLSKIKIGEHIFLIFINKEAKTPTGLKVGVTTINGKRPSEHKVTEPSTIHITSTDICTKPIDRKISPAL